ncbi:hypothetical protein Tco_0827341 [Tanacetum coccineum]
MLLWKKMRTEESIIVPNNSSSILHQMLEQEAFYNSSNRSRYLDFSKRVDAIAQKHLGAALENKILTPSSLYCKGTITKINNIACLPASYLKRNLKRFLKLLKMTVGLKLCKRSCYLFRLHRQEEGIDYDEVFALVARIKAIRLSSFYMDFIKAPMRLGMLLYQTFLKEHGITEGHGRESSFDLEAFSDSDYAGANLDRKCTTDGCQFLRSKLISWKCKKQTIVATSTTEAEYVTASSCYGEVLWTQNQMLDYGFNFMNTKIHIDNESTYAIVKSGNPGGEKIHQTSIVADLLTKLDDTVLYSWFAGRIGAMNEGVEIIFKSVGQILLMVRNLKLTILVSFSPFNVPEARSMTAEDILHMERLREEISPYNLEAAKKIICQSTALEEVILFGLGFSSGRGPVSSDRGQRTQAPKELKNKFNKMKLVEEDDSSVRVHCLNLDSVDIYMLAERKYPLSANHVENYSGREKGLGLLANHHTKQLWLAVNMSYRLKDLDRPKQTASWLKDFSNPFMADNLPKIVWLSTHHIYVCKELASPQGYGLCSRIIPQDNTLKISEAIIMKIFQRKKLEIHKLKSS